MCEEHALCWSTFVRVRFALEACLVLEARFVVFLVHDRLTK